MKRLRVSRLLDQIMHSVPWQSDATYARPFRDPHDSVSDVQACPLRLVLADDFTRCSTALAYSEGDRLSGCLDLVRIPNEQVWVEWAEAPRLAALSSLLKRPIEPTASGVRSGVLINAEASRRAGSIRSFWSTPGNRAHCASLIADFDLDFPLRRWTSVADVFRGGPAALTVSEEPAFDALLSHIRFRFDPAWLKYYRGADLGSVEQATMLATALGSVAFIVPMLFAAFLLLAAKGGAHRRVVQGASVVDMDAGFRVARSLQDVRGHLTRHGRGVLWCLPPLSGETHPGGMRSRMVKLSFH